MRQKKIGKGWERQRFQLINGGKGWGIPTLCYLLTNAFSATLASKFSK